MATATCRSCAAPVEWVVTAAGKRMPLDPRPRDDGNVTFTGEVDDNGTPVVAYVNLDSLDVLTGTIGDLFVSHFATCPQAADWRRR